MKSFTCKCGLDDYDLCLEQIFHTVLNIPLVLIRGDLASGKTTLVQALCNKLDIQDRVSSPTFGVLNEYDAKVNHYDIYQQGFDGFLQSGLLEKLEENRFHFIEWADEKMEKLLQSMKIPYLLISIESDNNKRIYKVIPHAYT